MTRRLAVVVVLVAAVAGCGGTSAAKSVMSGTSTSTSTMPVAVQHLRVRVTVTHPHDRSSFTEGLAFDDRGHLFESVGEYRRSKVREVEPSTGALVREQPLGASQFGEGLAVHAGVLTQLTWKEGVALRWSTASLSAVGATRFSGEGWGLAFDGVHDRFIQSDGSSVLTFRDPSTFAVTGTIRVHRAGAPVDQWNELEVVDGSVFANVWHSDDILRIDPSTGRVDAVVDGSTLWVDPARTSEMVLNGIAHRDGDPPGHLWLTGKNWPHTYEVDLTK